VYFQTTAAALVLGRRFFCFASCPLTEADAVAPPDIMVRKRHFTLRTASFCNAVIWANGRCGSLLAAEFPLAEGDVNELHDHLIVKD